MFCRFARSRLLLAAAAVALTAGACSAERPSLEDEAGASREVVADDSATTTAPEPTTRTLVYLSKRLLLHRKNVDGNSDFVYAIGVGIDR